MQKGMLERILDIEERHWWFRARHEILIDLLQRWVPPGATILDVGCGTGFFLKAAAGTWEVWGVDPAPEAVAFCHARGLPNVRVGTAVLGIPDLPQADAICFFDVLEHTDDDVASLKAAARQLKPGGLVFATVPAYQWLWSEHDVINHHRRRYTQDRLSRALGDAGLKPLVLGYLNNRLFPLAVAERMLKRSRSRRQEELLPLPPRIVNDILYRVFRSEKGRLIRIPPRPFSYGLSVLAVARAIEVQSV